MDSLQASLEAESRAKAEALRIKKKLESDINELEIALDHANKANAEANKSIKRYQGQLRDVESAFEEESRQRKEIIEKGLNIEKILRSALVMNNWYIRFMKFNDHEICLSWREWGAGEPVLPGQRPPEQPRHPAPHPQLGARHQEDGLPLPVPLRQLQPRPRPDVHQHPPHGLQESPRGRGACISTVPR